MHFIIWNNLSTTFFLNKLDIFSNLWLCLLDIKVFAIKNGLSLNKKLKNELSYKKDFIICATLGGISNALGNVFIIFATVI